MATVFLGRLLGPVGFSRTVAVKRLHPKFASDPEFVSMFLDEARLAARIKHPNVVPTLDIVATTGELFLVMEYVHGEALSKLMRGAVERREPIPVPVVVAIMSGALQGLDAAHEAKSERGVPLQIVHRDVSPQNIILGHDGQARVLDFGVARAAVRMHVTQEGHIRGKIAYMPPEQLRGEEVGPATDVYAAAVVLWEALTGRRLFDAKADADLISQVLAGPIPTPSEALLAAGDAARAKAVTPLDEPIMRALTRKRAARVQTARELARALEAATSPATAAQESDWVQAVAATTLRERASIVAEIESSSAIDLTSVDVVAALAATNVTALRDDPLSMEAATIPQGTEPLPTLPLPTKPEPTRPEPTLPEPTLSDPAIPPQPVLRTAPMLIEATPAKKPLALTMQSVPSPMSGAPLLPRTLQSVPSPVAKKASTPPPTAPALPAPTQAPRAQASEPLPVVGATIGSMSSATAPRPGRSKLPVIVTILVALVVALALVSYGVATRPQPRRTGTSPSHGM
jgi:serine/threonine protein kinase